MSACQCKICSNSLSNETFVIREMMFGTRENFTYFRCSSCGCLQITEIPEELSRYYPQDGYYSFNDILQTNWLWESLKSLIKYYLFKASSSRCGMFLLQKLPYVRVLKKLVWLKGLWQLKKNSSVLDVGCGNGRLLQEMNLWGFNNLTGIDSFIEKDIVYPSGIKIFKQDVFSHVGAYDLIMLHHSFEHMDNPQLVLEQLHRLLKPEGCLLIRIPVSDSFAWRKYDVNWFQIDAPRHFFLYTTKSMVFLSKGAGFILKHIVYDSTEAQFLQSEKYRRGVSLFENLDFSSKYIDDSKKYARWLNRMMDGDQACFVFQKEK